MIFEEDVKKEANKQALLLARTRYLEQLDPFVKKSPVRLAYVDNEVKRIIKECAEYLSADEEYVDTHLRAILADEAVTKPKKQDLSFGDKDKENAERGFGGGPVSPPLKFDPAQVNPEPDETTDLSYNRGPILEDELREGDVVHDLNNETFKGENKNNFSSVKEGMDFQDHEHGGEEEESGEFDFNGDPSLQMEDSEGGDGEVESALDDLEFALESGDLETARVTLDDVRGLIRGVGGPHEHDPNADYYGDAAYAKVACARCNVDIEDGVVCDKCSSEILKKKSNPLNYNTPGQTNINELCPACGSPMMPGQQACPGCGWSANNVQQQSPDAMRNVENARPDAVLNQRSQWGQYPSFQGSVDPTQGKDIRSMESSWKVSQLPGEMDMNAPPTNPQPQAPQPPMQEKEEPVRVDQGLGGGPKQKFDDVISTLANKAAAVQFSQPNDDIVNKIAQMHQLDPNEVRQALKVVSTYGNVTAVNGQLNGNADIENYQPVEGLDQQGSHKAQVPLEMAIGKVAQDLGMSDDDVYNSIKDTLGNQELPNQYQTDIQGTTSYYLPRNLMSNTFLNEPPEQPSPDYTQQDFQQNPAH